MEVLGRKIMKKRDALHQLQIGVERSSHHRASL
jgi:hypothetical protein